MWLKLEGHAHTSVLSMWLRRVFTSSPGVLSLSQGLGSHPSPPGVLSMWQGLAHSCSHGMLSMLSRTAGTLTDIQWP